MTMRIKRVSRYIILFILVSGYYSCLFAQERQEIAFNSDWQFTGGSVTGASINESVNLPHTWNAFDAQTGIPYYRGTGHYEKHFAALPGWKGKRVFIRFEGVMTVAEVTVNGRNLGEHRGGYSAFCYEITPDLKYDDENIITVDANNEFTKEVLPLVGDFNTYGGIYRPVYLIVTSPVCISLLDHASSGIYIKQKNVSAESADIDIAVKISSNSENETDINIEYDILDADGERVLSVNKDIRLVQGENSFSLPFQIIQPHLWNGKADPYLYRVQVKLYQKGEIVDSKTEPLGIRWYKVDPNLGFFLNGNHIPLHGVSRHQERQDKGNALSYADHKQDMDIMLEMGINALRLAHYQQAGNMYDLCDSSGVIVWAEMPWVGVPGGFFSNTNGYEPTDAFKSNARQQLIELIRQNYNHPSICLWSIFNEIQNPKDASPVSFINELNNLAKTEDPARFTTGASMLDPKEPIHDITDVIAFNRYFGWYYKDPADMGKWLDKIHESYPSLCIGISEYGAGGSVSQHTQNIFNPNPFGSPHPEEYQSYYHEMHLKAFNERPFVWGTFAWTMFDFGSQFRREGDHFGINDKGLVTYDRNVKKDVFYYYKANWSSEDVLYITSRRNIFRQDKTTSVKVYSNLDSVEMYINDISHGIKTPADGIVEWSGIELTPGNNQVLARGSRNDKILEDRCVWVLEAGFGMRQIAGLYDFIGYIPILLIVGILIIFYTWYIGFRSKSKRSAAARIIVRSLFFIFVLAEIMLIVLKILIGTAIG
jgi:beta-galactosidase